MQNFCKKVWLGLKNSPHTCVSVSATNNNNVSASKYSAAAASVAGFSSRMNSSGSGISIANTAESTASNLNLFDNQMLNASSSGSHLDEDMGRSSLYDLANIGTDKVRHYWLHSFSTFKNQSMEAITCSWWTDLTLTFYYKHVSGLFWKLIIYWTKN